MTDVATLERCIRVVVAARETIPFASSPSLTDLRKAEDDACARLTEAEGAHFSPAAGGGVRMRMAGISTTCTSGAYGAMGNWIRAARRRIEQPHGKGPQ